MLKPEETQTIEDFIRMIRDLDEGARQEAIQETNDGLEKIEGVKSSPLRMPVTHTSISYKQNADIPDVFCPRCGSHAIAKNGSVRGIPRLVCRDCRKSFGANHGSVTYESKQPESKWDKYLEGMVCSDTLQQLSEKCGISLATAHNWRIKVFKTLMQSGETVSLKGVVQSDEIYLSAIFKGNRKALLNLKGRTQEPGKFPTPDYETYGFMGHPRYRGGQDTKRGLSMEKICIPTAIDSKGSCMGRPMGRGNVKESYLDAFFQDRLDENIVLVTDKSKSGKSYAKKNKISHVALDSKTEARRGTYNLQQINNFHSLLGEMAHSRKSFSTKYCEEYLSWIAWLVAMNDKTVQEKVASLKAMSPARGKTVLVKDILKKEFPVELRT